MKRNISIFVLFALVCMQVFAFSFMVLAEETTVIEIDSYEDFINISTTGTDKSYKLTANIVLPDTYVPFAFSGQLIGDDETILKTITVNITSTAASTGLFSELNGAPVIKNIHVKGKVSGASNVGGIAGTLKSLTVGGTIDNCVNEAAIIGTGSYVGGIVGDEYSAPDVFTFNKVRNYGSVSATAGNYVGGIAGRTRNTITFGGNIGSVEGKNGFVGGISGQQYQGKIEKSYNTGTITTNSGYVGGISGYLYYSKEINNCYNAGSIINKTRELVAGIVSYVNSNNTILSSCYNAGSLTSTEGDATLKPRSIYGTLSASVTTLNLTNCYYLSESLYDDGINNTTAIKSESMKSLVNMSGLSQSIWAKDEDNVEYLYPQISGNFQPIFRGTAKYPYNITTTQEFLNIKQNASAVYALQNNLIFDTHYVPYAFSGTLLGNGYSITLAQNDTSADAVGLFSSLSGGSTLSNITLYGTVTGYNNVGGFAGELEATAVSTVKIENCYNYAVINGNDSVGGFVGNAYQNVSGSNIQFTDLVNYGSVTGSSTNIGGISGKVGKAVTTKDCANLAHIKGTSVIGGILGNSYGKIERSYNSGDVTGISSVSVVGGIAGSVRYASDANSIINCYNTGTIKGNIASGITNSNFDDGGVKITNAYHIGTAKYPIAYSKATYSISNSFYLSPNDADDGVTGTTPKDLIKMKTLATTLGTEFTTGTNTYEFPELSDNLNLSNLKIIILTVNQGENGSITPNGMHYVRKGDAVSFSILPNSGYIMDSLQFGEAPITTVPLSGGTYATTPLENDITVSVRFKVDNRIPEIQTLNKTFDETLFATDLAEKIDSEELSKIKGNQSILSFATVSESMGGYVLKDYGMVISKTNSSPELNGEDCMKVSVSDQDFVGKYGVLFYGNGIKDGSMLYIRGYAEYEKEGQIIRIYGNTVTMISKVVL